MKKAVLITFLMAIIVSCKSSENEKTENYTESNSVSQEVASKKIVLGAEKFSEYLPLLRGQRIALVVNQTSIVGNSHLVDTLRALGVDIKKVFAPEHGFRGDHSAGAIIKNGIDQKSGLPVVSLYGSTKKPSKEMLAEVDVVLFDIQDVGVRFYTYISTMHYVMEACAEEGKKVVVLDRPNPNGFYVDGPILNMEYQSFIGMHPIPIVHGLTVGELAGMINGEKWLKGESQCEVTVVPCDNYSHEMLYELPVQPSPNLPNMNSVYLYPYLGLFEGTNVSIGRGTDSPFQIVGRPGFDGVYVFTPKSIPGVSDHPKHEGEKGGGYVVRDTRDSTFFSEGYLHLNWLIEFYKSNRAEDGEYFKSFIYKLTGDETLKSQVEQGLAEEEIRKSWQPELEKYKEMRKKYLLYP
ncbi:MAG: DUF1343 domain-containing protein [Bacteroidia bacterium]